MLPDIQTTLPESSSRRLIAVYSGRPGAHTGSGNRTFLAAVFCFSALSIFLPSKALAERPWMERLAKQLADPLSGLRENSGVDIVAYNSGVWVGTIGGVSFTNDFGQSWLTYDNTTGLNANNTSALFALGPRIWIATAGSEDFGGIATTVGAGIQFSDNAGFTWQDPLDADGTMAASTFGPVKITFDIAGDDSTIFASTFVGGLIGTNDGGVNWKNFHVTLLDAVWFAGPQDTEPPLTSRYFSVVVDTAHTDSVLVFAGSAGGVSRFDFVSPKHMLASARISDFAYSAADDYLYVAGDTGISRASARSLTDWVSVFTSDFPFVSSGNFVNQIHFFGGKLFIGVTDSLGGDATGFLTTDRTMSFFSSVTGPEIDSILLKPGAAVYDFEDVLGQYLYVAGGSAGLFVSADIGLNWIHVSSDISAPAQVDPANGRNNVYAVRADTLGNLWCGTDSGLVHLFIDRLDMTGAKVDSARYITFLDSPLDPGMVTGGSGGSSRRIEVQSHYHVDMNGVLDTSLIDSTTIWSANRPVSDSGIFVTFRVQHDSAVAIVDTLLKTSRVDQMIHRNNVVLFAGLDGLRKLVTSDLLLVPISTIQAIIDTSRTPNVALTVDTATALFAFDTLRIHTTVDTSIIDTSVIFPPDTIIVTTIDTTSVDVYLGTARFAARTGRKKIKFDVTGGNWRTAFANQLPFTPDTLSLYTFSNSGLPGNFVPALAVQYQSGQPPIIWAASRPGDSLGADRTDVAKLDFSRGSLPTDSAWETVPGLPLLVWNFAFNDSNIYAATEEGLYFSVHPDSPFAEIAIAHLDPDLSIPLGSAVNGVAVIGDRLWVAARDGIATRPLSGGVFDVFIRIDPTDEVYAYPVPFSPFVGNGQLKFHYRMPDNATSVSISIYDFAMNLVSQVNENESRNPGEIGQGKNPDRWDGRNDKGEDVAPGIYYFKIEFSNGESKWGKLALIP